MRRPNSATFLLALALSLPALAFAQAQPAPEGNAQPQALGQVAQPADTTDVDQPLRPEELVVPSNAALASIAPAPSATAPTPSVTATTTPPPTTTATATAPAPNATAPSTNAPGAPKPGRELSAGKGGVLLSKPKWMR